tara:strand:- start:867 stop:1139 length:273 start_codon:yes stop_codon:yes gene_type:complete
MAKYEVEITKVFGLAITKKVLIEAKDMDGAIDEAKNTDWKPVYDSITPNNMSDSYEIAEVYVNGNLVEDSIFSHELLNEAIILNREASQQ